MKTDSQVQSDVMEELKWEPAIEAAAIGVEVRDGVVTLAGHVESHAQKWAAEHAAQRVAGVKGVVEEIDVVLPGTSQRNDADLAQTVRNVLDWNVSVPSDAIKVLIQHGWVTLSGEVDWEYQRKAAVDAVFHLVGVVGVNNHIELRHKPLVRDIKKQIEAALQRHAHLDAKRISVTIDDGNVTLNGSVGSWSERAAACNAVWAAPGVRNVIDKIAIAA
ncbi:MAG: BON domain-containing protein [Rudaea sp.]